MGKFDPDGIFNRSEFIESNDFYYIQVRSVIIFLIFNKFKII